MDIDFSRTSEEKNAIILKGETEFEKRVLLNMGPIGKWKIYHDGDLSMVIVHENTMLRQE